MLTSTFFGEEGGQGFYRLLRFFVPGTSREVLRGVATLVDLARAASGIATALLALTSLKVYFDVEGAANHLWGTLRPRRVRERLTFAALTVVLGPVALGVATSLLLERGFPITRLNAGGVLASIVGLALIYKVVPSAQVRWGAAAAAVLAGSGLIVLRQVFTTGFIALAGIERLYGTISAVAIFVIATGFAWTILLFGVSFAHALQFRDELLAHDAPPPAAKKPGPLEETTQLLLRLTEAWHAGVSLDASTLAETCSRGRPDDLRSRMKRLGNAGLVVVEGDAIRLARPPDTITLYAVARAVGDAAPRAVPKGADPASAILRALYMRADAEERGVLQGTSLEDVYRPHARKLSAEPEHGNLRLGAEATAPGRKGGSGGRHGSGVVPRAGAPSDPTGPGDETV